MDVIELGQFQAMRKKLLDLIHADPEGIPSTALFARLGGTNVYGAVLRVLDKLVAVGDVRRCHGQDGNSEYVMPDDPWYHEPKQRVMRKVVLRVLAEHMHGYSRGALARILLGRDKECDETYTRRLMGRMLHEGVVIVTAGTEVVMVPLVDRDGKRHAPSGAATLSESAVERRVTVFRLSAGRWLKDNSK